MQQFYNNFIFFINFAKVREMRKISENQSGAAERSRLEKLQTAEEVYLCECGRRYLTFSALYLHAKGKHFIRLTTKKSDSHHKIQYLDNKKYITYALKNASSAIINHTFNQFENYSDNYQCFKSLAQKYNNYLAASPPGLGQTDLLFQKDVIELMMTYIHEIRQNLQEDESLPKEIPFYFNDFIVSYVPKKQSLHTPDADYLARSVQTLYNFWKWLKINDWTEVELKLHELYSRETQM